MLRWDSLLLLWGDQSIFYSLAALGGDQSIFYFISVHIDVILDKNQKEKNIIYTNFPTGL